MELARHTVWSLHGYTQCSLHGYTLDAACTDTEQRILNRGVCESSIHAGAFTEIGICRNHAGAFTKIGICRNHAGAFAEIGITRLPKAEALCARTARNFLRCVPVARGLGLLCGLAPRTWHEST